MRTGACAAQQALTSEAAAVLKHALSLARRRGHAQITPLHVATALLAAGELFRRACLRSHPRHPRALELCFNVALNRLPTLSPVPLSPLSTPAFSNALVAALKRAQAHPRRGGGAADPPPDPPSSPLKVELEQLVISILDDPSVSRVMREAGFSSTSVKTSLELDCTSSSSSSSSPSLSKDLELLSQALLHRKNAVVVGDSVSYSELLAMELMSRVEGGADEIPEELRSAQWAKLSDLKNKVSPLVSSAVIIYVGDLSCMIEEDVAGEIGRLVSEVRVCTRGKVWLVAIADLQSYLKWKKRQPLLELQWDFQAVSVPSGGPALSLHLSSDPLKLREDDSHEKLVCCEECASSLEREAFSATSPFFLRQSREDVMVELRSKWNWVCRTLRHGTRSSPVLSLPRKREDLSLLEREPELGTWASEVKTGLSLGRSLCFESATLEEQKKKEGQVMATREKKRSKRDEAVLTLDLNLSPGEAEDEDDAVPSDLTHEADKGSPLCMRLGS